MKFQLLINTKMLKNKDNYCLCFESLRCCIYLADANTCWDFNIDDDFSMKSVIIEASSKSWATFTSSWLRFQPGVRGFALLNALAHCVLCLPIFYMVTLDRFVIFVHFRPNDLSTSAAQSSETVSL